MDDEEPGFLHRMKVCILGMGLMGSSLALALRGKCKQINGIDPDPQVVEYIRSNHILDQVSSETTDLLPQADLIILAAPVGAIIRLIQALPDIHPYNAIVMDLGSTKTEILKAMQLLPERFDPIGGHPMCGRETLGPQHADPAIFQGSPFVLSPLARTSEKAKTVAQELVQCTGAVPLWLDAVIHDYWAACTSHLPYLVANALAAATPNEAAALARAGWQSTTRLAHTSTSMMMDILATNRENILHAVRRFQTQLNYIEALLQEEDQTELKQQLDEGTGRYLDILSRG